MRAIRERVLAQGAEAFFCAVLTEKTLAKSKPIVPDFVGLRVPDRFVFGCGMDARGYWRNLPAIYALKQS
jgi:hypoxanthine phosphoribosyltransferase